MDAISVKINRKSLNIEKKVFLGLLDYPVVQELDVYKDTLVTGQISFSDLKQLAIKAYVPYPLFFGSANVISEQIKRKDEIVSSKLPSKEDISLASRGTVTIKDIELIARDIGRKQELLKTYVLNEVPENSFVNMIPFSEKSMDSDENIATNIRNSLGIDLEYMRTLPKANVLAYLSSKSEEKYIFISFSSRDCMPQNIHRDVLFSGVCVKDKKFPFIFINRREADDNPRILETEGRQILTLVCMLVCIAMNKFIFSLKENIKRPNSFKRIYSIAGRILIPTSDLKDIQITSMDELLRYARKYKVTPSMFLMRLILEGIISKPEAEVFFEILQGKVKKQNGRGRLKALDGYIKYNGIRFSREVSSAYKLNKINSHNVKSALFRRSKVSESFMREYINRFV